MFLDEGTDFRSRRSTYTLVLSIVLSKFGSTILSYFVVRSDFCKGSQSLALHSDFFSFALFEYSEMSSFAVDPQASVPKGQATGTMVGQGGGDGPGSAPGGVSKSSPHR